ncbi:mycothiol synthase [Nocardia speluncae]|uniref:Mycothiol acetyltransferase n=1 Tax=Nocardia speluncae TaxID=419477 RepID=A0A846XQ64_9NOCA|nr:mycothiol synthase [Nocardia speluncae]NKY35794.1 mycothiol synthase [Nocardia speluncae]
MSAEAVADFELRWVDGAVGDGGEVSALLAAAAAADGVAPVSEQGLLALRGDSPVRHLLALSSGVVAGYAGLTPAHDEHPAMAEAAVAPAHRGRGIGRELVAAVLASGGSGARVWAHGKLPAAEAVAARLGLVAARELWQMRRPLATPQLPDVEVPAGIVVRHYAGPADDAELLRVNNAAFAWHPEQGGWTASELAQRRAESWFDPAGLFLAFAADDPGRLLGFHWTKVHRDENPPAGEVYVVGIDPAAQGRGLGRLLTLIGLHYLRDAGLGEVLLYTEADNTAAVRTYSRLGFGPAHIDIAYTEPDGFG